MDPDPRIRTTNLRIPLRILFFSSVTFKMASFIIDFPNFFCLLLFKGTFTLFFKGKKSLRSPKTVEIKVFLTIFACRCTDPDPYK
jgi:hypothetical protein